jgi:hypothetical protein
MTAASNSDRNPVEALADDFIRRQRGGEKPTIDEYCRRHPELADEIRGRKDTHCNARSYPGSG